LRAQIAVWLRRWCWASIALAAFGALLVSGSGNSAAAAPAATALTLFSVASEVQYVNNADDRARGEGSNPFGNYSASYVAPPTNEKLFGPFPGDEGEFASTLYTGADHDRLAGTAIVICQYNFDEDAFCDAAFHLASGSLIAKGSGNFNATDFTFEVIGGTYGYKGTKGTLVMHALGIASDRQSVNRVTPMLEGQRLDFVIHRV
jgi:hypothetical protein